MKFVDENQRTSYKHTLEKPSLLRNQVTNLTRQAVYNLLRVFCVQWVMQFAVLVSKQNDILNRNNHILAHFKSVYDIYPYWHVYFHLSTLPIIQKRNFGTYFKDLRFESQAGVYYWFGSKLGTSH